MAEVKNEVTPGSQFKDSYPMDTVRRIKDLLHANGIEEEVKITYPGVPYCVSCRVGVKGTNFAVSGKGMSEEFALASGYGELMERLQLGLVGSAQLQKSGQQLDVAETGLMMDARKLLEENRNWYEVLSEKLYRFTGIEMTAEEILMQYADQNGQVGVASFYNLTKQKREYFPIRLYMSLYGSNGCAAGNTLEETIVQAISEIEERYHQAKIIREGHTVPNIPREVWQKFEYAYQVISYLEEKGYRVEIKDCTLNDQYPVVCACFIDKETGRYHAHFGASPVLQIAVERALTETFLGRDVNHFTFRDSFSFPKDQKTAMHDFFWEFRIGESSKTPWFFVGQEQTQWNSRMGFTGENNQQMLRQVVKYLGDQGCDVLVRDASGLGFPACQVIIPGRSESLLYNLSPKHNPFRHSPGATRAVQNPSHASWSDYFSLLKHMEEMKGNLSIDGTYFIKELKLSLDVTHEEAAYIQSAVLGYVSYAMGNLNDTLKYVSKLVSIAPEDQLEQFICLKRYLTMKVNHYDERMTRKTLEYFQKEETVRWLYNVLENNQNPLDQYTLHCGTEPCENCRFREKCSQEKVRWLLTYCREKREQLDYRAFEKELRRLLLEKDA